MPSLPQATNGKKRNQSSWRHSTGHWLLHLKANQPPQPQFTGNPAIDVGRWLRATATRSVSTAPAAYALFNEFCGDALGQLNPVALHVAARVASVA